MLCKQVSTFTHCGLILTFEVVNGDFSCYNCDWKESWWMILAKQRVLRTRSLTASPAAMLSCKLCGESQLAIWLMSAIWSPAVPSPHLHGPLILCHIIHQSRPQCLLLTIIAHPRHTPSYTATLPTRNCK